MAHPFAGKAETGRDRAKSLSKGYKLGGAVGKAATVNVAKYASGGKAVAADLKAVGRASGGRLDKFARGGRTKGKGGHHTKININIAPKGPHPADGAAPPGLMAPPLAGGPPPGLPPGGPPPGGLPPGLGAGPPPGGPPPGMGPKPPGMMKRGGAVKKYASGGFIKMKAGADTGPGRLEKAKKYKARG